MMMQSQRSRNTSLFAGSILAVFLLATSGSTAEGGDLSIKIDSPGNGDSHPSGVPFRIEGTYTFGFVVDADNIRVTITEVDLNDNPVGDPNVHTINDLNPGSNVGWGFTHNGISLPPWEEKRYKVTAQLRKGTTVKDVDSVFFWVGRED